MSYFEGQTPGWPQEHGRQGSWSQPAAQSGGFGSGNQGWDSTFAQGSGASPVSMRDEGAAFASQLEEIDRASDNLAKSGKSFGGVGGRRDSTPMLGSFSRQYPDFDRMPATPRHHSMNDYDGMRSHSSHSSSSLQGYLANQRFGPRQSEADQMLQAKRRAAAQRERELRNYHQEQQYNRNLSGAKSDRSMSPNAMNEEDRRELIARQHRALYGDNSSLYTGDGTSSRPVSQDARVLASAAGGHASSPLPFDGFGPGTGSSTDAATSMPTASGQQQRSPTNSASSKSPNPNTFTMFDNSQQPNHTSSSSPGGSPPNSTGVAPIGTRPAQNTAKRNTPPTASPLSYGYANDRVNANSAERSTSAASNPVSAGPEKPMGLGWAANSGPWASTKNTLGVQASVWG